MKYVLSVILLILFGSAIVFGFGFVYGQSTFEPRVVEKEVVVEVPTVVTIGKTIVEMEDGWRKITGIDISWK